jgi:hypothetical protein
MATTNPLNPPEPWRTSQAKVLLWREIEDGIVDENSDLRAVHEGNPLYKQYPFARFKTNMKNLIKAVKNGKKPQVEKWGKSEAKKLLKQDIIDGTVKDQDDPRDVYYTRPEFQKYEFDNFKTNLKNLKEAIYGNYERMASDCEYYGHDLALLKEIRKDDPPLQTPWHKSEAKALLEQDIEDGKHLALHENGKKVTPKDLYMTRAAYREFSLRVFRDHIYQTAIRKQKQEMRFARKKRRMKAPQDVPADEAPHRDGGLF